MYENPWIDVLMADVELADGTRFEHHVVRTRERRQLRGDQDRSRPRRGAADLAAPLRDRQVGLGDPLRLIEEGEDAADAARREVEEETGWRVRDVTPLLTFHPVGGMLRTRYRLFRAIGAEHIGEPTEQNEAEKVAWIPLDEVLGLIDAGQIATSSSRRCSVGRLLRRRLTRS